MPVGQQKITSHDITNDTLNLILRLREKRANLTRRSGGPGGGGGAEPPIPGMANPMTAEGDIIVGGEGGAPTRRAIGDEGDVLVVVSGLPQWSASGAGFNVNSILTNEDGDVLVNEDGNVLVSGV